jgi:uncharacterized protein YndB with AHSA1/START domain
MPGDVEARTQFATPTDTTVTITRVLHAPRRLVYEAWTNPEHLPKWLLGPPGWTMPVCEIDLRVGGRWHYVWRNAGGTEMDMTGVFREVKAPERLVCTERWGPEWPETVNTVTFTESAGRTTVVISILYPGKAARDAAMQTGMKDGMDMTCTRLEELLATLA